MTSIDLLGPVRINGHLTGTAARAWKYTDTPQLIALLVLHPDGLPIDRAVDAIAGGNRASRSKVHQLASDARKVLGRDVFPAQRDTYGLEVAAVDVDLVRFTDRADRAAELGPGPARLDLLIEALAEVRGRLFGGADWDWAVIDAAEISARIEQAATDAVADALALGRPTDALVAARAGLAIDTYHAGLMTDYARAALAAGDAGHIARAMATLTEFWGLDAPADVVEITDHLAATRQPHNTMGDAA